MKTIYHISPHYRLLTIWHGHSTGQRSSIFQCRPDKGLSKFSRYAVIKGKLIDNGLRAPQYNEPS